MYLRKLELQVAFLIMNGFWLEVSWYMESWEFFITNTNLFLLRIILNFSRITKPLTKIHLFSKKFNLWLKFSIILYINQNALSSYTLDPFPLKTCLGVLYKITIILLHAYSSQISKFAMKNKIRFWCSFCFRGGQESYKIHTDWTVNNLHSFLHAMHYTP